MITFGEAVDNFAIDVAPGTKGTFEKYIPGVGMIYAVLHKEADGTVTTCVECEKDE